MPEAEVSENLCACGETRPQREVPEPHGVTGK
jgi:hypothetical protein